MSRSSDERAPLDAEIAGAAKTVQSGERAARVEPCSLDQLVNDARILVCCGSGGVGKTTTAAVLALRAAAIGRRAVVVTIDPARRLADAMGLAELTNEPTRVEVEAPGELWAMMLDTAATFDGLVRRHAADQAQIERIFDNRFYRNISGALSGTQEYMAAEKLYELHHDERFDLVVIDTPPTRNALDFLDAPGRLTRFLDHRLYRILMAPTRLGMKVMNVAAQAVLKTISKIVGGEVIADVIAFFQAFDGMEAGFRERAHAVMALLRDSSTRYVIVASPRHDTVSEATFFADKLGDNGIDVAAVIINRLHPTFGDGTSTEASLAARSEKSAAKAELWANLAELRRVAEREAAAIAPLLEQAGEAAVARVPLLAGDVHDLGGLAEIGRHLFAANPVDR
jgi:anion-transporting  ArsA/GET3 family ATPase